MEDKQRYIRILLKKLDQLEKRQAEFQEEIRALRREIMQLQQEEGVVNEEKAPETVSSFDEIKEELKSIKQSEEKKYDSTPISEKRIDEPSEKVRQPKPKPRPVRPKEKSDFEKFIGENLINKIGIVITVLGVSFGIKYAIDHEIISPAMRIVLAYMFGGGLVGLAMYLKKNYENFSAVLLSGAMAIFYFTTYIAYDFYNFIPQTAAFTIMVLFTAFTVYAALHYNQQVIAHVGLVGAYAVPFLLSDGSGRVTVLFSYMTIINMGILAVAVARYWKSLYYSAFVFTWLIYFSWWGDRYVYEEHFKLAFTFSAAFFLIFYATLLSYKLIKKEKYSHLDVLLVVTNSFVYYGAGYALLNGHEGGQKLLGVFTLANALLHFAVSVVVFYQKLADRSLFYLIAGMVLVFVTIAIPVQLDGNWVTFLWATEAALLFWIGRSQRVSIYEVLSYPLMVLTFFSIIHDWGKYNWGADIPPIFNISFLTSALVTASFILVNRINRKTESALGNYSKDFTDMLAIVAPTILVIVSFCTFYFEIANYAEIKYQASAIDFKESGYSYKRFNEDIKHMGTVWVIIYQLVFAATLSLLNQFLFKKKVFGIINIVINAASLLIFLTGGLIILGDLRESYLQPSEFYDVSFGQVAVRYVAILAAVLVLFSIRGLYRSGLLPQKAYVFFDLLIHIPIIWMLSNEIINWMQLQQAEHSYKLEITILWGVYSLMLIAIGIGQKKKHLRISAIVLFSVTLIKLFFYDISQMEAIGKTVVFVALGILLLTISFLYNKYKDKITDNE